MMKNPNTKRFSSAFSHLDKCGLRRAYLSYTILCYINNYSASLYYAQRKKYMWVSAGNVAETAYVLSMMYFLFIFLHRTGSLSVCQIMCQILEGGRKIERSSKKQMKRSKARGGVGGGGGWLLLGNNDTLKDEKEEKMRQTQSGMQ